MPLRSALLLALLLAALAAAQWSDVVMAVAVNTTTVKVCAVDNPTRCVFTPVLNATIDPLRSVVYATDYSAQTGWIITPYTVVIENTPIDVEVYVPAGGYIWHYGNEFTVDGRAPDRMKLCGRNENVYGVLVGPGRYNIHIDGLYFWSWAYYYSPLWFTTADCRASFMLVHQIDFVVNFTRRYALMVLYMPTANATYPYEWTTALNGTAHAYFVRFGDARVAAAGFYIANKTRMPTFAYYDVFNVYKFFLGPHAYDAYLNKTLNPDVYRHVIVVYNIGPTPGDGVAVIDTPDSIYGAAEVGWIGNGTGGYLRVLDNGVFEQKWLEIFVKRYSFVEVAIKDDLYEYSTRTIACPPYVGTTARVFDTELARLDRAKEIELCNNMTSAIYVALANTWYGTYAFIDEIKPGECRRLRWDGVYGVEQTALEFYDSPQNLCRLERAAVRYGGQDYATGWRYYVTSGYSLVPASPIDLDTLYAEMWKQIIENMAKQYNETQNVLQQWLQMQANATKKIEDYYKSLPQYQGTIRMESSTSVWLQSVLSVISRYTVPGLPPVGGGFAPAPLPSGVSAAAAAAAVAVAWAASRRSLATAAFLAGFAILASALFVYYLYGTTVTAGLILAAVALMSIGAAAAWFRRAED